MCSAPDIKMPPPPPPPPAPPPPPEKPPETIQDSTDTVADTLKSKAVGRKKLRRGIKSGMQIASRKTGAASAGLKIS